MARWYGAEWWTNSLSRLACVPRSLPPQSRACKSPSVPVFINTGLGCSMTDTLSSKWELRVQGPSAEAGNFLKRDVSVQAYLPAHPLGHGLRPLTFPSSMHTLPTPLQPDSHSRSFHNNSRVPIIFASWGKIVGHRSEMPKDLSGGLKRQMLLCLWADGFHTVIPAPWEPFPVASTTLWYLGSRWCEDWDAGVGVFLLLLSLSPLSHPLSSSSFLPVLSLTFPPVFHDSFSPKRRYFRKGFHRSSSYFTFLSSLWSPKSHQNNASGMRWSRSIRPQANINF